MKYRISQTAIATVLAATLAGPALAEQYICQTQQSTGFAYEGNGNWASAPYAPSNTFLVDTDRLVRSQFGDPNSIETPCEEPYEYEGNNYYACPSMTGVSGFMFNETMLRFTFSSHYGYAVPDINGTPVLDIGTCVKLGG
jgi:hypothetical protein